MLVIIDIDIIDVIIDIGYYIILIIDIDIIDIDY